jgi:hypothetical protein
MANNYHFVSHSFIANIPRGGTTVVANWVQ